MRSKNNVKFRAVRAWDRKVRNRGNCGLIFFNTEARRKQRATEIE
jgi:hypothetical protein